VRFLLPPETQAAFPADQHDFPVRQAVGMLLQHPVRNRTGTGGCNRHRAGPVARAAGSRSPMRPAAGCIRPKSLSRFRVNSAAQCCADKDPAGPARIADAGAMAATTVIRAAARDAGQTGRDRHACDRVACGRFTG